MSLLLALETSGSVGSVALGLTADRAADPGAADSTKYTDAGPDADTGSDADTGPDADTDTNGGIDILARVFMAERGRHAAGIVPAVGAVLDEAGRDREEIDGVVVGSGPGSFTGVRVAAATAKGLAHGLGRPLYAVSSLAAAAVGDLVLPWNAGPWAASPDVDPPAPSDVAGAPRYVLFDARGNRLYAACYRPVAGRLEELVAPAATTLEAVLGGDVPDGACFVGEGALRHREGIREAGFEVLPAPAGMPTADGVLHALVLAGIGTSDTADASGITDTAVAYTSPVDDPATWEPAYLRASGAERERSG